MVQDVAVTGLINGGVYALLGVGFSLVFGVARIVNLSHTALYALAAYLAYYTVGVQRLHPAISLPLVTAGVVLVAVLLYRGLIAPVRAHEGTVLVLTVGIALALEALFFLAFGGHYRGLDPLVRGSTPLLGVEVSNQHLLSLVTMAGLLLLVWLLLTRTRLGIAIRAVANDREVANLMGIDVTRAETAAMAVAAALAAAAGVVVAPLYTIDPLMWVHPLIVVLAVVIVGGLGSIKGSVIAAFLLALAETLVIFLLPVGAFLRGALSLAVMLVVLLIRPEGLYGVFVEGER